jgi:maleate isomerase
VLIAHTPEAAIRDTISKVGGLEVDAVATVGTNLPMARVTGTAEFWLDKPVVALNTTTCWYALRQCGIYNKVQNFGRLLAEF